MSKSHLKVCPSVCFSGFLFFIFSKGLCSPLHTMLLISNRLNANCEHSASCCHGDASESRSTPLQAWPPVWQPQFKNTQNCQRELPDLITRQKKKKKRKPFSRPSQLFKGFPPQEEHITEDERGVLFISHVRLLAVIAVIMWHGEKSIIIKNMKMQGQLPEQPVTVSSQNTSKTPASADDDLSSRKKGVFPQRGGNANVSFLRARLRDTRYIQRP